MPISMLLGVLVGAILGLTGAGGGILAVPALVFGLGLPMQQAAPVALIAVSVSASVGAFQGFRFGLVRYKAALLMAAGGLVFTWPGHALATLLPQPVLLLCFAGILLFVAFQLVTKGFKAEQEHASDVWTWATINPDTGRFVWTLPTALAIGGVGALTGFMSGLLGVGGGFVLVPLLKKLTQLGMQSIVATSLMVIALVGTGAVGTALLQGTRILPLETGLFTLAVVVGMGLGRHLMGVLKPETVQRIFVALLIAVALGLVYKGLRGT
ncbi:MAG: sulfite exporter TauE/SafE family protein [Limnobacter sp.]|nr:sulfite exporter TauE/SafE family protein [Limnobacter sp.]